MKRTIVLLSLIFIGSSLIYSQKDSDNIWLEDVLGKKSLEWVKEQNTRSTAILEKVPGFKETYDNTLKILNAKDRIPYAIERKGYFYNFWTDEKNPRGVYRRTTLKEYKKSNPKWEIILDIDKLAKKEGKNWVYKGSSVLYPDYDRMLVKLSDGGSDAVTIREFDIPSKSFVKKGFIIPMAKNMVSWRDRDSLYVGSNFGKDSLTKSGYPRIVKIWKRGTSLKEAKVIFETARESIWASGGRMHGEKGDYIDLISENVTFFNTYYYYLNKKQEPVKIKLPPFSNFVGYFKKQFVIKLQKPWKKGAKIFKPGSILIGQASSILKGDMDFKLLIEPGDKLSISSVSFTKNTILVNVLEDVVSKLLQFKQDKDLKWNMNEVKIGDNGSISVFNTSELHDDYFVNFNSFLVPSTLYMVNGKTGKIEVLKKSPDKFNAKPYITEQKFATSKDGTKIPYFIVRKKDLKFDGNNPTLLYGYGGFMISMRPRYSSSRGINWLEKGGVYVLSNIRGGGEYGPKWHQAAKKKNKLKSYEDFIAIAEDLIKQKITSPQKLAIQGGSNGGLLVGAVFVLRPDLFKAVVCQVPLLDMKRYTRLLAGASWAGEYGDPDKADMWNYIKKYSPYHNVKKDIKYPEVFFNTSTKDDRVHPAHARKMVAKMMKQGHKVYYYENTEGGHAGAANNKQRAYMVALEYAYLYKKLMNK